MNALGVIASAVGGLCGGCLIGLGIGFRTDDGEPFPIAPVIYGPIGGMIGAVAGAVVGALVFAH